MPGQTTEDLVSVRSDGAIPGKQAHAAGGAVATPTGGVPAAYMGRAGTANRQATAPLQFMRHGQMQNHRYANGNVCS